MSVLQKAVGVFQKAEEARGIPLGQILGAFFLLATVAISAKAALPLDFVLMAVIGFFLCSFYQQKGCLYALGLLGFFAAVRHGFFDGAHLWSFGLESSLGCAFVVTGLSLAQEKDNRKALQTQVETRTAALQNLEEELVKVQESATEQQRRFEEKWMSLQKELEETQSNHSSLLILNEVLRKNAARLTEEKEEIFSSFIDFQRRLGLAQVELQEKEKECQRLLNQEALAGENKWLLKELNQARFDREQTHLINETLARLHAKECLKAKEAREQICQIQEEKAEVQKQFSFAKEEIQRLSTHMQKLAEELEQARGSLVKYQELQTETHFLQERLQAAQDQIQFLEQKAAVPQEDPQLALRLEELIQERGQLTQRLNHAQDQIHQLSQIEPLYKQLRKQFEEKNEVLHQTRVELFRVDTELQTLRIEKQNASQSTSLVPEELQEELEKLNQQVADLDQENELLQELVTHLNEQIAPSDKKKKKEKTGSDQDLLF